MKGSNLEQHYIWKRALTELWNSSNSIVLPSPEIVGTNHPIEMKKGLDESITEQMKKSTDFKKLDSKSKKEATYVATAKRLHQILIQLKHKGYISAVDTSEAILLSGGHLFSLSVDGVNVAIKIQEHFDSDRRHNDSMRNSKGALAISILALIFAAVSISLNYKRLDLYEKQIIKISTEQMNPSSSK